MAAVVVLQGREGFSVPSHPPPHPQHSPPFGATDGPLLFAETLRGS
jgi:hypothetical protein